MVARQRRPLGTRRALLPPEPPGAVAVVHADVVLHLQLIADGVRDHKIAPPLRLVPLGQEQINSRDVHEPVVLAGPARVAVARRALEVVLRKTAPQAPRQGASRRRGGEREGAGAAQEREFRHV